MQLYEAAIQEALKKHLDILLLLIVPTKPETGYGYIERKGDDVISFRKNQPGAPDFIAKGNFL
jgi:mannose-1-phosphate guanylyltransferase